MSLVNRVTWAVAGGRKTQEIVDACAALVPTRLRVALTFTLTGQSELTRRLSCQCPADRRPEVSGWYSFLIKHWIRPYLPYLFNDVKDHGFSFDGEPGRYATGTAAYFDADKRLYRRNLARLAFKVNESSGNRAVKRLEGIYSEIYIDEVQDLCGWDLEIVDLLLKSSISMHMVGDARQCVYSTNPQERKNSPYQRMGILEWFELRRQSVSVHHSTVTYRSVQPIADLADSALPSKYSFQATTSQQIEGSGHSGIYWLHPSDLESYVAQHSPLVLAWDKRARAQLPVPSRNFGDVKGITALHVVIQPTGPIINFLNTGAALPEISACKLYVGLTRAVFSVAFMSPKPLGNFPRWVSVTAQT